MNIELLWIFPILGFGVFVSLAVFLIHSKYSGDSRELNRKVKQFNSGVHHVPQSTERAALDLQLRLSELERSIASLTKTISAQQKQVESISPESGAPHYKDLELKNTLDNLYREYGVILNENQALRSRLPNLPNDKDTASPRTNPKVNLRIFNDTRYINTDNFDDTAEFDTLASGDR
ncbi:MAG: hypothetical protein LBI42_09290 [Chitinispirillales bacterium]|jgi:chromosome segregation ATPase|nr:hypothetical protein [Chitinispirillales bacterium]